MREKLIEARRVVSSLLLDSEGWQGLYADTESPPLTRVWREWGQDRISLNSFGACEPNKVFWHLHEWDFGVYIQEGECEMLIGARGPNPDMPPEDHGIINLVPGSSYVMVGSKIGHWVRSKGAGYASVMVSGPPRYPQNRLRVNTPTRRLTSEEILA